MMQPSKFIKQIAGRLEKSSSNPEIEAEIILSHILHITREEFFTLSEILLTSEQTQKLQEAIESRLKHTPLQYITGYKWFHGHKFLVNDHTFIPRDDTEILVENGLDIAKKLLKSTDEKEFRVLDLCTGSGAIIISLCSALLSQVKISSKKFEFIGGEISKDTIKATRKNIKNILPKMPENASIDIIQSDLFEHITGQFDLIISNPPYIPETDRSSWQKELDFEPQIALTSGEDGMDAYNEIIPQLVKFLKPHGAFLGEIHPDNYDKLEKLAGKNNLRISPIEGLYGERRFVYLEVVLLNRYPNS